ncbi:MAG TPA: PAS domain S-box protein [Anaeromyxobacter sp.]
MTERFPPKLLDLAPVAVILHDRDAYVVEANEEACRSLGYTRDELVGKHVRELVEGMDPDHVARMQEHVRTRGSATYRAIHRRKDGTTFPVETHLALVRGEGPVRVVAFVRDASENEQARAALAASEERYRLLLDLLPDGVVTYDAQGRITFVNAAGVQAIGASRPEDVIGLSVLDRVHAEQRASVAERMSRTLQGERGPTLVQRLLRLDGREIWAETRAAPLAGGSVIAVIRDVTERRLADEDRGKLMERLRQAEKIEALGTLAGGVAHDFNNVLAAILGHAAALADELPPGSVGREDAEHIAAAARRAKGVVQQILAFARRRPSEAAPVDVSACIQEDLALVRAATPANVEIAVRAAPDAGAVQADPTQLHQVLLNLAANARDAMAVRGGVLAIAVERASVPGPDAPAGLAPGSYVRLSVADTGHGMDEATRARAFEPYFTTKPVGAGSGLGLSVVHGIAAALGGAVSLESAAGEGTRVDVWLPRLDAPAPATAEAPARAVAQARRRVLLVDDDPPVARALSRMLASLGYEVTTDDTAEAALERFRAAPEAFDAVLTDQTLPRMGGDELTLALLAIRPGLPVLICTGYSARLDEAEARAIGARALLPKPLDLAELAAALSAAIGTR